jgi:hypothetical protein
MRAAVLLPFELWLMKIVLISLTSCVEPPYYKSFPRNTISNIYILRVRLVWAPKGLHLCFRVSF